MEIDVIKCGDCVELMGALPSQCIDLTVTSPPYDNLREYHGGTLRFEDAASELFRVTKMGGCVVWIVNDAVIGGSETGTSFRQALYFKKIGFNLHDTMIWKKDTCAFPERTRYFQTFEYMFVFSKGRPKTFNPIADRKNRYAGVRIHGTYRNADGSTQARSDKWKETVCGEYGVRFNVWEQATEKANKTGHPAVFPKQLAKDHILSWSNVGDVVLDPFIGSGTTAVACKETGRHYIGFDISEEYCRIAKRRVNEVE